jgi:hypothetical protein
VTPPGAASEPVPTQPIKTWPCVIGQSDCCLKPVERHAQEGNPDWYTCLDCGETCRVIGR